MPTDDKIGEYCAFNPDNGAFLDAANAYCYQFRNAFDVPRGSSSSNVYQMKIGNVPDGFGGKQIFWGMLSCSILMWFVDEDIDDSR